MLQKQLGIVVEKLYTDNRNDIPSLYSHLISESTIACS